MGTLILLNGSALSWRSSKQPQIAKSTADSEITAAASSAILGQNIRALLESMLVNVGPFDLLIDNKAAIVLATGEGSWKTKALANRSAALKDDVARGDIIVKYVDTNAQAADGLTKFLPPKKVEECRIQMGLIEHSTD